MSCKSKTLPLHGQTVEEKRAPDLEKEALILWGSSHVLISKEIEIPIRDTAFMKWADKELHLGPIFIQGQAAQAYVEQSKSPLLYIKLEKTQ